ncbi:MAG: hypoxanthine phosphoribosyltransferase [Firmicutes bacterium]|nr:hypoxanthine phosphoribosyltransferase [Eubacterium sp.]MBR2559500.1 hypoxanthine phosphoribosyltransferase [Bacillota bacterium]MBR3053240.1 hypoxanthine phosphoribosyltransferase [Bacillota bacterium]MCR4669014.1 hypoxanthine phosphoribosyltransferase [Clostridia bacterium]
MAIKEKETVGKILYTQEQIYERVEELAREIEKDYEGEELILLCTLKGAVVFMADMMKAINLDTMIDFIAASSYGSGTSTSGFVKVTKDVTMDLYNKNVLIIEDIVDSGTTLKFLKEYLQDRNPKSVKIATLLDKPARRTADVTPDYVGFTVDDLFIIGYGLDYDQRYRNLPYISYLDN